MDIQRSAVLLLVAVILFADGSRPRVEVYEIRKRIQELRNDDQYRDRNIVSQMRDNHDRGNNILNKLQRLLRISDRSYEDDASELGGFEDKTRSIPIVLITDDKDVQRSVQTGNTVQKLLQAVLQNRLNDMED